MLSRSFVALSARIVRRDRGSHLRNETSAARHRAGLSPRLRDGDHFRTCDQGRTRERQETHRLRLRDHRSLLVSDSSRFTPLTAASFLRPIPMRHLLLVFLLAVSAFAQTDEPKLPAGDAIRINEFYRVAGSVQDQIWPGWSKVPAPLMLVTPAGEFLTHHPSPPK